MLKSPDFDSTLFCHRNRVVETLNWNVSYGYLLSSYMLPCLSYSGRALGPEVFSLAAGPRNHRFCSPENIWNRIIWNIGWWMPGKGNPPRTWKSWWGSKWRQFFVLLFKLWFLFAIFFASSFHCKNKHVFLVIGAVEHRPDGSWLWATWWQTWWSRGPISSGRLVIGCWETWDVDA